ncbi:hypothetical protein ACSDQ9_07615 [Aestuariimicrobium soli]|uniref:hypothetical protein n=1 Tax=Aestuariimicrobium soli TaxID=2035834 RepID=UPI003EC0C3BA
MKINVVHALPTVSQAYGKDFDGFSAALEVVATRHEVEWLNVHPYNADAAAQRARLLDADFVLVRSDWGWYPDALSAGALARTNTPCGLVIAGSSRPQSFVQSLRYDVLFYETPWYAPRVARHPLALQGLAVDSRVMHDQHRERDIDWLFVGRMASFKRPERLLDKQGVRVVAGDLSSADPAQLQHFRAEGVTLIDHVSQAELADLYNRARSVLVPCELQGGGERAVLEGRACGCHVEVADDNPKLASLLDHPVDGHEQYAAVLLDGIEQVMAGRRTSHRDKLLGEADRLRWVFTDKLRRSPDTVRIRWRNWRAARA